MNRVHDRATLALEELETLSERGGVDSGAYAALAKRLKCVHDAAESNEERVKRDMVIHYAVQLPSSLTWAPPEVYYCNSHFINEVVRKKRAALEDSRCKSLKGKELASAKLAEAKEMEAWVRDLVDFYLDEDLIDTHVCESILLLIETDVELFGKPVAAHLHDNFEAKSIFKDQEGMLDKLLDMAPCLTTWALVT